MTTRKQDSLTPQDSLATVRLHLEQHGPDTDNRHIGRTQFDILIQCCDNISAAMDPLSSLVMVLATQPIEAIDNVDHIPDLISTLEDVIDRLRDRWDLEFPGST